MHGRLFAVGLDNSIYLHTIISSLRETRTHARGALAGSFLHERTPLAGTADPMLCWVTGLLVLKHEKKRKRECSSDSISLDVSCPATRVSCSFLRGRSWRCSAGQNSGRWSDTPPFFFFPFWVKEYPYLSLGRVVKTELSVSVRRRETRLACIYSARLPLQGLYGNGSNRDSLSPLLRVY